MKLFRIPDITGSILTTAAFIAEKGLSRERQTFFLVLFTSSLEIVSLDGLLSAKPLDKCTFTIRS
jgi:hypothetical protein